MDRASRKRVVILGSALIVLALLLVCGPLKGRFGQHPAVAAGPPPADMTETVRIAVAASAAGAALGDADVSAAIAGQVEDDELAPAASAAAASARSAVVAASVAAAATGLALAESSAPATAAPSTSTPPPVSAGVPIVTLAAAPESAPVVVPSAGLDEAAAERAFDSALAASPAGKVVDRFAPPVASGPVVSSLSLSAERGINRGRGIGLKPCDLEGAGCRNLQPLLTPLNPIGSGALPPPPSQQPGSN